MKNKKLIITLIVLLSIISVSLIVIMVGLINNKFNLFSLNLNHNVSSELALDETYDISFNSISLNSDASDIYIKNSIDNNTRVVIYGDKDNNIC